MSARRKPARPPSLGPQSGAANGERLHADLAARLIDWQRSHGRHALPWQRTREPYRVWLSEIMLQQTQVATVLGYYDRFLQRFPDVHALAAAPLDDVLAMWSGLGYYSRARNLHRCAQQVVAEHAGVFPPNSAALAELPGIGRSTAAAIAAFCHGERVAILDGNVKRVLTRVLGDDTDLAMPANVQRLWQRATALLPQTGLTVHEPADLTPIARYTQGLMDLGATLCTARKPQCSACPWREQCAAHRLGRPEAYPVKTRKLKRGRREHALLWLERRGAPGGAERAVWMVQRPGTGVWAGLWSLPEFESLPALQSLVHGWPGHSDTLPTFTHVLTHFDWHLTPLRHVLPDALDAQTSDAVAAPLGPGRWVAASEMQDVGLPAPVRKLVANPA